METPNNEQFKQVIEIPGTPPITIYARPNFDEEEVITGIIELFGISCHIQFIRVAYDEENVQYATKDPNGWFLTLLGVDDIAFRTFELPGYEGEWVLLITPFEL